MACVLRVIQPILDRRRVVPNVALMFIDRDNDMNSTEKTSRLQKIARIIKSEPLKKHSLRALWLVM